VIIKAGRIQNERNVRSNGVPRAETKIVLEKLRDENRKRKENQRQKCDEIECSGSSTHAGRDALGLSGKCRCPPSEK
jgi:hypothetical protein